MEKMEIVIQELTNYRGRTDQRYLLMKRIASRNGLDHITPGKTYTLPHAVALAEANGWEIVAIGDFYAVV